jgi:hypothetical protein
MASPLVETKLDVPKPRRGVIARPQQPHRLTSPCGQGRASLGRPTADAATENAPHRIGEGRCLGALGGGGGI